MRDVRIFIVKKKLLYITPFLAAIYPGLFLLSQNISEYKLSVLVLPLLISIIFACTVFVFFLVILRKSALAIPLASVFVVVVLSYTRLYEIFLSVTPFQEGALSKGIYILVLITLFAVLMGMLYRGKKHITQINELFLAVFLFLVVIPVVSIFSFEIGEGRLFRNDSYVFSKEEIKTQEQNAYKPDIYYFIFDRYAGERTLTKEYKFNNQEFKKFLEDKGFYVASQSASNYPKTFLSLASSLNMKYLDFLTDEADSGASSDESFVTPYIQKSEVLKYLKQNGYTYLHLGSWWQPTSTNPNADKNYVVVKGSYWGTDEFSTGFLNSTAAGPILNRIRKNPMNVSQDPKNNDHRRRLFFQFEKATQEIPQEKSPKFVFAHILAPHDPFVVDEACTPVDEEVVNKYTRRENYLRQLTCTNSLIEKMIEQILKNSKQPPIIILQADEGPFPTKHPLEGPDKWLTADTETLREKFPILNAYYFPDKNYKNLYPDISPVNSFRIVFTQYFGEKFKLLEDKSYIFQDENNLYKFQDVTEIVK